jgi:hypothetical protein
MSYYNRLAKLISAMRIPRCSWRSILRAVKSLKWSDIKRWSGPTVALLVALIILWNLGGKARREIWAYYTDGEDIRISAQENKARSVLWEPPSPTILSKGEEKEKLKEGPSGNFEAAFSADGRQMALVLEREKSSDIFISSWDGRVWSAPELITNINTDSNERGPAFSASGNYLYFSSDRKGGHGGYDIYAALWNGAEWASVKGLGSSINGPDNETGPAPSSDDSILYFSSDRNGIEDQDIYAAVQVPESAPLQFADSIPVKDLNSRSNDIQAALTKKGSHVFLSSDREDDSVFGVYMSRVIGDEVQSPERVDLYIKEDNVTDPAVRMDGFDLLFSTDYGSSAGDEKSDYRLYKSTTREVFGYRDSSRWEEYKNALGKLKWWLIAALLALLALIYLLETWQDITSLLHKCIAASMALHLLLLLLATAWFITQEFEQQSENLSSEIAISLDALSQEELAMESAPEEAEISDPSTQISIEKAESDFNIPELKPQELVENVPEVEAQFQESMDIEIKTSQAEVQEDSIAQKVNESSLIAELSEPVLPEIEEALLEEDRNRTTQDKKAAESNNVFEPEIESTELSKAEMDAVSDSAVESETGSESVASGSLVAEATQAESQLTESGGASQEAAQTPELASGSLPELALVEPGAPKLEEVTGDPGAQQADPSKDTFEPGGGVASLETVQEEGGAGSDSAVESETGSESVASGSLVAEATQAESQLTESGGASQEAAQTPELASGNLPVYSISAPLLPDSLESNRKELDGGSLTDLIKNHRGKPSIDTIKQMGGSDATEKAIVAAIEWLSKNQEKDGRWDTKQFNAEANYDVGGTGLALLCYYGWGARHDRQGKYQNNVKKALSWLINQQNEDGNLAVSGKMYSHAIGTIALCEAYGITKDSNIKIAAQKAISYTISSQHPQRGGWRYRPGQNSDTSVTGWQFMALHSARMAGIDVPEEPFELARRWLDFAGGGEHGGLYGYKGPSEISRAMVATGMFCRQLDLVPPTDPRMIESAQLLKNNPLRPVNPDLYYIYYATLALYQHQGPIWQDWNNKLKETLPKIQNKTGKNAGSWDLSRLMTKGGGRVASTTLAILSLEVYYRILPMYGFRGTDVPEIKLKEGE